jgi:hypothetical protein
MREVVFPPEVVTDVIEIAVDTTVTMDASVVVSVGKCPII